MSISYSLTFGRRLLFVWLHIFADVCNWLTIDIFLGSNEKNIQIYLRVLGFISIFAPKMFLLAGDTISLIRVFIPFSCSSVACIESVSASFREQFYPSNALITIMLAWSIVSVLSVFRYICVVLSESCPIPRHIVSTGTLRVRAMLAQECRATYMDR